MTELNSSKRKFLKTAAYVAPAILTLKAIPSFASSGSGRGDNGNSGGNGNNGVGNGYDPQPPGNPPTNDAAGTSLGNPGNSGGASYQAQGGHKKKKRLWYQFFS